MDSREDPVKSVNPDIFVLVTAGFLLENRAQLERSRVPVYRVTGQSPGRYEVAPVSFSHLGSLAPDQKQTLEFALPRQWGPGTLEPDFEILPSQEDAFHVRWNALLAQSPEERLQELAKTRQDFELRFRSAGTPEAQASVVAQAIETAFLVNRASMGWNKAELTDEDRILVQETTAIVRAVVTMVVESHLAVTLFRTFQSLSNGQTVNHIVRVFSTMVSFLAHYNVIHSRGLISKLRAVFVAEYEGSYRRLLPGLPDSLVTLDNLVRLPHLSEAKVRSYALGALMHDIGKVMDLGYFENGTAFDPVRIKQHPVLGSGLFQRTYGVRHEESRYIVGDHHNYLFHQDGYGLTRWERLRGHRPVQEIQCCIAESLEVFLTGRALGFLPVEICSIVDVYDALTDPVRQYKTVHEPAEAIAFMDANFRAAGKIDPVLFDLFVDFIRSMGVPVPPEYGFQGKYDRRKG